MSYEDMVLNAPGVVAYWPMDDISDLAAAPARDATGNNNPLSVVGTGLSKVTNSLGFVKLYGTQLTPSVMFLAGQYLASPNPGLGPLASGPSGPKTIELWVNHLAFSSNAILLGVGGNSALYVTNGVLYVQTFQGIQTTQLGKTGLPLALGFLARQSLVSSGINLGLNQFHHIVARITPNGSSSIWLDGAPAYTFTAAAETGLVGASWVVGQNFWGYVQHVAVYSGIFTDHRVRQHWRVGQGYEDHEFGVAERLFVPNANCPALGSFNIKGGYALFFADLQARGGIATADSTYLDQLRRSGYFTESAAA